MRIEKMTVKHLMEFYQNVRKEDLEEIRVSSGADFQDHPLESFVGQCALLDDDGTVLGMGGVDDHIIWLVTTKAIETRKVKFLRFSKQYLKELLEKHGFLMNAAWGKNKLHIDWLTWLGAEWIDSQGDLKIFKLSNKKG